MLNLATTPQPAFTDARHIGRAVLAEDERPDGSVMVRLAGDGPGPLHSAMIAVPRSTRLTADQEALVVGDPHGELYVVGVLSAPEASPSARGVLATGTGAYATTSISDDGKGHERLRVFSPRNELLFEYEPASGRTVVNVARGNLELRTEDGDIDLQSAGTVRIGGQAIELTAEKLDVKTKHTRWIVDKLETIADTVLEKAKNAFRTVEQLAQLRTGRMRTLVDETYQFKSKNAYVKAEKDYKIKADQIHLG